MSGTNRNASTGGGDAAFSPCDLDSRRRGLLQAGLTRRLAALGRPFPITRMELVLTENCTLCCDYCFVAGKQAHKRMSWPTARKAVDFLMSQSLDRDEVEIVFFGGEPLIEFELMRRIAAYAEANAAERGKRVRYAVTTNGTIMSEEIISFAQERGLNYLLSIDGDRASHDRHRKRRDGSGSWDEVTGEKFRLLKRRQGWVGTRLTVNPDTVDGLVGNVRFLASLGLNQFIVGINADVEWSAADLSTYIAQMQDVADFYVEQVAAGAQLRISSFEETVAEKRSQLSGVWGCDAGRSRVAISTGGEIYPCSRFVSPSAGTAGSYRLGHVDSGLDNLGARAAFMDNADASRPKCAKCNHRLVCAGGCPALNMLRNGSIFEPAPHACLLTEAHIALLHRIEQAKRHPTGGDDQSGNPGAAVLARSV